MEEDLLSALSGLSLAIYNPGSDVATAQRPNEIVLGRAGNDFVTGLQPLATDPNPPQVQIDILAGDLSIEDPAMRRWNNTFALGDWQQPYYANNGINDLAVILDFNAAKDTIQLYGNSSDYQVLNFGIASAIVYEKPTGPDVIGVVLGSNLDLNASYFEYRGTTPPPGPAVPQIQQLGSIGFDAAHAVTTDPSGNVYVGGGTTGDIGGTNAGQFDGFFTKYDSQGNQLFSKQLGTSTYEEIFGTRTDNQGNFYVSGLTDGALGGPKQAQQYDAFVAKYDSNGNQQWIQQVGQNVEFPTFDLAVDPNTGASYISGPNVIGTIQNPDDAYIIKFDSNGNKQWQTSIGTSGFINFDESYGVAVSQDGNVLATGWTNGNLAAPNLGLYDNWVAKLDSTTGATQWIAQYGTPDYEWSWGVASDSQNNVYTTGWTLGNLGGQNAGSFDAYLAKFDSQGNQQWIQQFGTAGDDEARAISIDANNNIFLTGYTTGNLGGTNAGSFDAWVAEYDTNGNQKWITQFGSPNRDDSVSITADKFGNLYVAGDTQGSLGSLNAGSFDAWTAKLDAATGTLLSFTGTPPTPAPQISDSSLASSISDITNINAGDNQPNNTIGGTDNNQHNNTIGGTDNNQSNNTIGGTDSGLNVGCSSHRFNPDAGIGFADTGMGFGHRSDRWHDKQQLVAGGMEHRRH